jgi:hypothetical protein
MMVSVDWPGTYGMGKEMFVTVPAEELLTMTLQVHGLELTVSLAVIVTAPFLASALPFRMPPSSVILVSAMMFPTKVLFV